MQTENKAMKRVDLHVIYIFRVFYIDARRGNRQLRRSDYFYLDSKS